MWISFGNFYDCEVFKWRFSFVTMFGSLLSPYFLPSFRAHIACHVSPHLPTLYGMIGMRRTPDTSSIRNVISAI
jgi:hypothetical protein